MKLFLLLVDDEQDVLDQLLATLPKELIGFSLVWDPCNSFEEALDRLESRRYDVVITDMAFRGKPGAPPDLRGMNTVGAIRGTRFCPIVAYSSRAKPEDLIESSFLKFADKARGNADILSKLTLVLESGIPKIARQLHDELDGVGGKYLWDFLANNWTALDLIKATTPDSLERLIRRRASIQLARLVDGKEVEDVGASEFYINPKISGGELRLGEIIKQKGTEEYRVILTPHCHLTVQEGDKEPRADFVLTLKTVKVHDEVAKAWPKYKKSYNLATLEGKGAAAKGLIGAVPRIGKPQGRFWFLPRFLSMPDLYCDFMQMESVPFSSITADFECVSVLDTPYAEALQAKFTHFYSSVGTANLRGEEFVHLIPEGE